VRLVLEHPEDFNGVYANPDYLAAFGPDFDAFFINIVALQPTTVLEHDLAAQAIGFVWGGLLHRGRVHGSCRRSGDI
jgi:hypothetical protein